MSRSRSTLVLSHGHITDPMQSILDAPVAALESEKVAGVSLVTAEASDSVAVLGATLTIDGASAFDSYCSLEAGPINMALQTRTDFNLAYFNATMPFIDRAMGIKLLSAKVLCVGGSAQT